MLEPLGVRGDAMSGQGGVLSCCGGHESGQTYTWARGTLRWATALRADTTPRGSAPRPPFRIQNPRNQN
jgi:hypothetical protein